MIHDRIDMPSARPNDKLAWSLLALAWLVALTATLGALFVGEVMGKTPCILCWYQRIFMFPLAVLLGVATFASDFKVWRYGAPLAIIGGAIAGYHSLVFAGLIEEALQPCSQGVSCSGAAMTIVGGIPLPYLSLAAFAAIAVLLYLTKAKAP